MAEQIVNHKCPACGGGLHFSSETGKLVCEFCDSSYEVSEIEAMYAGKEEKATDAFEQAEEKRQQEGEEQPENWAYSDPGGEETPWNTSGAGGDWGDEEGNMRSFSCPSCGAEILCEATTGATSCPYCDNPTVIPGQFSGNIKPDYIIPFKLNKEAAKAALKEHYKGKILLPKDFKDSNHIDEVKGIYVPFWMFSAEAMANVSFEATKVHTYRSGDYEVTRTDHFSVARSGSAAFERIPTDASKKMPDDYMDSLEPFNYSELKDFSTAYMPGYLADKYDVTIEECTERADLRCRNSIVELLRNDVHGYATVREVNRDVGLKRGDVKYALLPVWILNTTWNGTKYMFAMNGQTGKIVGDLPVSKKKLHMIRGGVVAAITLIMALSPIGGYFASLISSYF